MLLEQFIIYYPVIAGVESHIIHEHRHQIPLRYWTGFNFPLSVDFLHGPLAALDPPRVVHGGKGKVGEGLGVVELSFLRLLVAMFDVFFLLLFCGQRL